MDRKPDISAVLPAFNEEDNLEATVTALDRALKSLADKSEILLVNDGSADRTAEVARELAGRHPSLRVIDHPRNRGYGAALRSGFAAASLDWIFFMDADGQFDPSELSLLIDRIGQSGLVIGYRRRRMDPWQRRLYGTVFSALVRAMFKITARDVNCAFKLFKRELMNGVEIESAGALVNAELLARLARKGARPVEVPVSHFPRKGGRNTGGSAGVILRAGREFLSLYLRLRQR